MARRRDDHRHAAVPNRRARVRASPRRSPRPPHYGLSAGARRRARLRGRRGPALPRRQSWAIGGFLGVDAFFVLSGFLITTLLVTEWGRRGRIDLARVLARGAPAPAPCARARDRRHRGLRSGVRRAGRGRSKIRGDGLASIFYVANWKFIFSGQSYFDQFTQPSPFRHMWSLAIEEQFYLMWPLIVFGVLWFTRSLRWLLGRLARDDRGLGRVDGCALRTRVTIRHASTTAPTPARSRCSSERWRRCSCTGTVRSARASPGSRCGSRLLSGAVYTIWLWSRMSERTDVLYQGGFLLAALAVACVIVSVTQPDRGVLGRFLSLAPLRWIGMISYGLYLWHWPVYLTLTTHAHRDRRRRAPAGPPGGERARCAAASFYLVERPIRQGTFRLPRPIGGRARDRRGAGARTGAVDNWWVVVTGERDGARARSLVLDTADRCSAGGRPSGGCGSRCDGELRGHRSARPRAGRAAAAAAAAR